MTADTAYDDWTKEALYEHAKELGIEGCDKMDKEELLAALRTPSPEVGSPESDGSGS